MMFSYYKTYFFSNTPLVTARDPGSPSVGWGDKFVGGLYKSSLYKVCLLLFSNLLNLIKLSKSNRPGTPEEFLTIGKNSIRGLSQAQKMSCKELETLDIFLHSIQKNSGVTDLLMFLVEEIYLPFPTHRLTSLLP